jgi:uncharacterized protein (DUF342 family)
VSTPPHPTGLRDGTIAVHDGRLLFEAAADGERPPLLDWEDGVVVLVDGAPPESRPCPLRYGDVVDVATPSELPRIELQVDVASDNMSATLTVERHPGARYRLADEPANPSVTLRRLLVERVPCPLRTVDALEHDLRRRGVRHGVQRDALERCLASPGRAEQVAWGTRPGEPVEGTVAFEGRPPEGANGGLWSVEARQLLARATPARRGSDGCDVHGEPVPAVAPKTMRLVAGENVEAAGGRFYAAVDGFAMLDGATLRVEPEATLPSVDEATGDVAASGPLLVAGPVEGRMLVARQRLRVAGPVERAEIELAGSGVFEGPTCRTPWPMPGR